MCRFRSLFIPLAVLVLVTVLITVTGFDLTVATWAFQGNWRYGHTPLAEFLYRYGLWPALGVSIIAFVVWFASYFQPQLRPRRQEALFLVLLMLLGPGLLVNTISKGHYGRARPSQVVEFGGSAQYSPVWQSNWGGEGRSFPSGHAATGFYWLGLFVFYAERNRARSLIFLAAGLVHGSVMGVVRILQGGHWLTDILWAGGLVYAVAWILYRALKLDPKPD